MAKGHAVAGSAAAPGGTRQDRVRRNRAPLGFTQVRRAAVQPTAPRSPETPGGATPVPDTFSEEKRVGLRRT